MLKINFFLIAIALIFLCRPLSARAVEKQADTIQDRYAQCLKLMGEEKLELAIQELQNLLSDYPGFQLPYRKLVEAYIFLGNLEQASRYFQHLQKKDPTNPYPYYALARINFKKEEYEQALQKLKRCISLNPHFAESYGPFGGLPDVYKAMHQLQDGEAFFKKLIETQPGNPYAYYGLARIYVKQYRWDSAIEMLTKSIEKDSTLEYPYHLSVFVYEVTGQFQAAFANSLKLRKTAIQNNDLEMVAYSMLKIGGIYFLIGNYRKALSFFIKSLKLASEIGAKRREGMALTSIGAVYATLGKLKKAQEYFIASLDLLHKTGAFRTEIISINNIGLSHKDLKNYPEALKFFKRAATLAEEKGYKTLMTSILLGTAETYFALKKYDQSLANYRKALSVSREVEDKIFEGSILARLGDQYYETGNLKNATEYFLQALKLSRETRDMQTSWEAHSGLGASYQKCGKEKLALYHYGKAIAIFDSVRNNLDIESLAGGFLEDRYEVYPSIIQLLAQENKSEEAFDYAEKYKAKNLLRILTKGQLLFSDILPDSIRFQLVEIRSRIEDARAALADELSGHGRKDEKILLLDQQVTDLELKQAAIINSVSKDYREYYQLTSAKPLGIKDVQTRVLEPGELLLEFVVGSESTSLFAVSPDTLYYFNIDITKENLQQELSNVSAIFRHLTAAESEPESYIYNADQADFSIPPAFSLFKTLFGSSENILRRHTDLIIVPDDFLYYLPFEALVTDTAGLSGKYDFGNAPFLIKKFNISYSSSASLLDTALQPPRHPSRELLAIGNPDFKVKSIPQDTTNRTGRDFNNPDDSFSVADFLPLPNAEDEVKSIARIMSDGSNAIYTGEQCKEGAFKEEAQAFRIIHLATHFIVDDQEPLYSKVVLSQPKNTKEDGFLQTYEIFGLRLNADLVVLSACNTAMGKLSRGEGMIGASRAFLYAGVPSMVVSMWNVDDQATSIIMKNFYKYLRKGMKKSRSLRMAKLDYLNTTSVAGKDPFYWSPFVLMGDTSPVPVATVDESSKTILYAVLVLIILGAFIIFRQKKRKGLTPPFPG